MIATRTWKRGGGGEGRGDDDLKKKSCLRIWGTSESAEAKNVGRGE